MSNPDAEKKALVLKGSVSAVAAGLVAMLDPASAPYVLGLGSVAAAHGAIQDVLRRRATDKANRVEAVLEPVMEQLRYLEDAGDEEVDLFLEIVNKVIDDDESDKQPIHSALIQYLASKPGTTRVRILANAVQSLSYVELYCFLHEMHDQPKPKVLKFHCDERVMNECTGIG